MRRAAVIGLLACACAHRPSVRPASGWHELVSEHFVLATDAPESRSRELLSELEDAHSALRAVSWHAAHDTLARVKVIAFYRPSDAEEVLGSSREGIFYRDLFGSRGIVVQLGGGDSFHKTLNHEIAHQQLSEFVEHAPRWLDEGLACYLETVRFVGGSEAVAGEPDRERLRFADASSDWNAILETGENALSMNEWDYARFQSASWLLVHYLVDERRKEFGVYLLELARGVEPRHAFTVAFGGLDGEKLRGELRGYLTVGRLKLIRVPANAWQGTVDTRPLAASDVHGMRAMLLLVGAAALGSHSAALDSDAEANASLERDPGNADAAAVSLYWRYGASAPALDRESAAREIIRAHPDDWRGWAMLADARQGTDEAGAARARAAELAPANPAALEALARDQLARGQAHDAVIVARRAVTLAPTDPEVLETYAAALAGSGDCAAATGLQQRVVELMRERGAGRADSSERLLRAYEGGCSPMRGKKSSR
ncbi:MAG: hypothetical protein ACJ79W_25325 [Myxococcales bacterium]